MSAQRVRVLAFGKPLDIQTESEFANRGLQLVSGPAAIEPLALRYARGAVFAFSHENAEALAKILKNSAAAMIDHGLKVELLMPDDALMGALQAAFYTFSAHQHVQFRVQPQSHDTAESLARYDAGTTPRQDLEIEVAENREPIAKNDLPLFHRAFSNCKKIVLMELTSGKSAARVFAVHMTVDTSPVGLWPQPSFAKIDRNDKIDGEYRNYRQYADRFIPFGLRPNIENIIVGSERSLLVGDFVDKSESLWALVQRNVARQAVTALVEETLVGWRDQAYAHPPEHGSVALSMKKAGICKSDKIQDHYFKKAQEKDGAVSPAELWSILENLDQTYRIAPVHGDLHGENVRVKNGQAILIDLASVNRAPFVADLAALETWFAFEPSERTDLKQYADPEWQDEINRLYAPTAFLHPPGPCDSSSKLCWMTTVVRQIRTMGIAAQSCPTEYQSAVAAQLLRRCQWVSEDAADRFRRGHGYIVATSLAQDASKRSAKPSIKL